MKTFGSDSMRAPRCRLRRPPPTWLSGGLCFVCVCLAFATAAFGAERVYDAADLVRASRMLEGVIPADIEFADLDGDGAVTAADLALMLRRVHGQPLPVRLDRQTIGPAGGSIGSTNTFLLTVPEGAFAESVTLTLELVPAADGPPPGEDTYGPLYQVNGKGVSQRSY